MWLALASIILFQLTVAVHDENSYCSSIDKATRSLKLFCRQRNKSANLCLLHVSPSCSHYNVLSFSEASRSSVHRGVPSFPREPSIYLKVEMSNAARLTLAVQTTSRSIPVRNRPLMATHKYIKPEISPPSPSGRHNVASVLNLYSIAEAQQSRIAGER